MIWYYIWWNNHIRDPHNYRRRQHGLNNKYKIIFLRFMKYTKMLSNKGSCPFTADTEQEQQSLIVCLSKCFIKFPTDWTLFWPLVSNEKLYIKWKHCYCIIKMYIQVNLETDHDDRKAKKKINTCVSANML